MADDAKLHAEELDAEERSAPSGRIVYKAILKEGKEELERPSSALFWSGLAAGLSMGFSMIAEGLLASRLPDAPWRPLITKLGYSVGFLIVVLGRQQLFTENTLTPILPLLRHKDVRTSGNVLRLWSIVLVANLLGAFAVSLAVVHTDVFWSDAMQAFLDTGLKALAPSFSSIFLKGIFAGWLIALMVWLLNFAETARAGSSFSSPTSSALANSATTLFGNQIELDRRIARAHLVAQCRLLS